MEHHCVFLQAHNVSQCLSCQEKYKTLWDCSGNSGQSCQIFMACRKIHTRLLDAARFLEKWLLKKKEENSEIQTKEKTKKFDQICKKCVYLQMLFTPIYSNKNKTPEAQQ